MDVQITRAGTIYQYDAQRDGYDTNIIKNLTGTPSISSNKLLLSSADICTFISTRYQQVELLLNVPVAPVSGQSKTWGLQGPNKGNRGAIIFNITDTTFAVKVYKADNTLLFSRVLTWSSAWTAADTRFRIMTSERSILFLIEDSIVAQFDNTSEPGGNVFNNFTHFPLPVRVTNGNADNLLLADLSLY